MKHSKKSSSKFMNDIQSIFKNVYLLYLLVFIAVVYLFILLSINNFNAIGFFILLGIIVYYYTKNMSIILSICLLFTFIIFALSNKEGMDNTTTSPTPSTTEKKKDTTTTDSSTTSTPPDPLNPLNSSMTTDPLNIAPEGDPTPNSSVSKPVDSFTGKLAGQSRIDPASTMTQAFTNLENMLGGENINKLSNDTENLVKNQAVLLKTIENMTPLIDKASTLMSKFSKF